MRILVIGGTQFVGRAFVEAALAGGHSVTLFHRGKTGADLFPDCDHRLGDRLADLSSLSTGEWDVVLDSSAYVPRAVRLLAEAVKGRIGGYYQVSTISVYAEGGKNIDEDSPVATIDDPTMETVTNETYGPLKALCEEEAKAAFGEVGIFRPTYVVGPHDHTDRLGYWIDRLGRNLPVVLPVRPDGSSSPMQWVDARDLAKFMLKQIESGSKGTYNTAGPWLPMQTALEKMRDGIGSTSEIIEWPNEFEGKDFPMIMPHTDEYDAMQQVESKRAMAAGMTFRSPEETAHDAWAWWSKLDRIPKNGAQNDRLRELGCI